MTQKFDSKVYQNKNRIYRPVPGATNILRLWVWSAEKKEYRTPERGNVFDARRYEYNRQGGRRRVKRYFETLEEARAWKNYAGGISSPSTTQNTSRGNSLASNSPIEAAMELDSSAASQVGQIEKSVPTFSKVVSIFRENAYPCRACGTQNEYDKKLRLHFSMLMPLTVTSITPKVVDDWLCSLKKLVGRTPQWSKRVSFEKELDLLALILRYFDKYNDDFDFRFPIKQRHREDMFVRRSAGRADRDLPRAAFERVRAEMALLYGDMWWALFTLQWQQALRISEAAVLHWEDVHLNFSSQSRCKCR